ncbi:MAG: 23S rRNA (guanosine(2251)-2'-O)-methyltransferase RlmB [Flavobacteriales bacterium]|nr:23S rRNA (guanosine(2251)-2'-O)-methyltransferase RlmB [Flavobacteriales bacterium]
MQHKDKSDLIFGIHPVLEAINSGQKIAKLFCLKKKTAIFNEILTEAKKNDIAVSFVPVEKLNRLVKGNHQGVVAQLELIALFDLAQLIEEQLIFKDDVTVLLLDRITDTRNFGAIVRTAECFGVDCVVIPDKESSAINGFTIKSSAGAIFNVKIARENLKDAIFVLKSAGFEVISITEKTNESITGFKSKRKRALILGSEEKGISPFLLKNSDHRLKIDLHGNTQSFNVSVAAGISLYALKN